MDFRRVTVERDLLGSYVNLMQTCFPGSRKYNINYLQWLYVDNPHGQVVGYDAWDDDHLAAHYVCIPTLAQIEGTPVKALLSLNTATHPNYQGRGLFTKLAERTYATASAEGINSIYGVANANSTPGFVRKLGFQLVEPLDAKVGLGFLHIDPAVVESNAQFKRIWTRSNLAWRCANPNNPIVTRNLDMRTQFHATAVQNFLSIYAELSATNFIDSSDNSSTSLRPWRLYIGLEPLGAIHDRFYADIPQRFRPSPLNFIYRSLTTKTEKLEKGNISFSFLDFDAY